MSHPTASVVLPIGATDCHCHIFGPADVYPLVPERLYEPEPAPLDDYRRVAENLGFARMVLVQPTPYGIDNQCLLDTMQAVGIGRCRGVVVLSADASDNEIDTMSRGGARAARLNFVHGAQGPSLAAMRELAARIAPHGWHLEIFAPSAFLPDILQACPALPVDVVLDHMGSVPPVAAEDNPALRALLAFLGTGRGWVKLCGYRNSRSGHPYADIAANARALISAYSGRCVWGTDWPHGNVRQPVATRDLLDLLLDWVDRDNSLLDRILSKNPTVLYGFADERAAPPGQ